MACWSLRWPANCCGWCATGTTLLTRRSPATGPTGSCSSSRNRHPLRRGCLVQLGHGDKLVAKILDAVHNFRQIVQIQKWVEVEACGGFGHGQIGFGLVYQVLRGPRRMVILCRFGGVLQVFWIHGDRKSVV